MSNTIRYTSENQPSNVTIGNYSYCYGQFRGSANKVCIGNYTSIAEGVRFDCGFGHRTDFVSSFPFVSLDSSVPSNVCHKGDIHIGSDVWIGENALIMSGVSIGDGAIIGTGAIVTKNVMAFEIVGGIPAKSLKMRFPICHIMKLMEVKWWNWNHAKVMENAHLLSSGKIKEFLDLHYNER